MEGKYIDGVVRYNLISLLKDGIDVYTQHLSGFRPGTKLTKNEELHLDRLQGLVNLLEYLEED